MSVRTHGPNTHFCYVVASEMSAKRGTLVIVLDGQGRASPHIEAGRALHYLALPFRMYYASSPPVGQKGVSCLSATEGLVCQPGKDVFRLLWGSTWSSMTYQIM